MILNNNVVIIINKYFKFCKILTILMILMNVRKDNYINVNCVNIVYVNDVLIITKTYL